MADEEAAEPPRSGRPGVARRARAAATRDRIRPAFDARVRAAFEPDEAVALGARFDRRFPDVFEAIERLYGDDHDLDELLDSLLRLVVRAAAARSRDLRRLDRRREIAPDWYQREDMVGYVTYVDRFAGDLAGVAEHLDHLGDLGVTYLHLMPLLRPRPAPNDGGYAVADYRAVDPDLGTMTELEGLATELRGRGISLCVDLVVNHTAREHEWARRAAAGEQRYRDYYLLFEDRTLPDRYEETLWEVFPDLAPGSFTWSDEVDAWVWTSFYDYQWDLDHSNPQVFAELLDVILSLANRGVEVLRLDAVPFLWKRLGTSCQNLPEAHLILQAWRGLLAIAAPATIFKAEAIVAPGDLVPYLGAHDRFRPECEIAYHNQLMVMSWSMLAERDARLATTALARMRRPPPWTSWVTYVRCHDDIGWAVTEEDAESAGRDAHAHRRFLSDFFAGDVPMSYARGARFGVNPRTGDARTSGMTASLVGIEEALELGADPAALPVADPGGLPLSPDALLDQAVRRMLLLYAIAYSYGGIPLVWMGDELALRNDRSWDQDPGHAGDNRWLHRPAMDWTAAGRRHEPGSLEAYVFGALRRLGERRAALPHLRAGGRTTPVWTDDSRVFAFVREHDAVGRFLGLANVSDVPVSVDAGIVPAAGLDAPVDALADDGGFDLRDGRIHLDRLQMLWLADDV